MRDIEKKAMALLNASEKEMGLYKTKKPQYEIPSYVALYLAIEQHEATKQEFSDFRQEVSDAVELSIDRSGHDGLRAGHINEYLGRFIIPAPKPDPLVDVMKDLSWDEETAAEDWATDLRAALDARGLEIREKEQ